MIEGYKLFSDWLIIENIFTTELDQSTIIQIRDENCALHSQVADSLGNLLNKLQEILFSNIHYYREK